MLNTYSIATSKDHWLAPFTFKLEKSYSLSTREKITAVVAAILAGIVGFGIGGVICFYALTAYFKSRKMEELSKGKPPSPSAEVPPVKATSDKILPAVTPVLHIYTTGLGDAAVVKRWNKFYYPYLQKLHPNSVITHFDPLSPKEPASGGTFKTAEFHIDKEQLPPHSVVFDFAHSVSDYDKYRNAIYIPYHADVSREYFLDHGYQPFEIEGGQIVTYITQLRLGQYEVVEKSLPFTGKGDEPIQIPFKTIKVGDAVMDTKEKLEYLYKLIREFELRKLGKDLELDPSRALLNRTKPGSDTSFREALYDAYSASK